MKTIDNYKVSFLGGCDGHHAVVEVLIGRKRRQGIVDFSGNFCVEPIYQYIDLRPDCWYAWGFARTPSQKYNFVSLQLQDKHITNGAEGQCITLKGINYGVDDANGQEIIAHKYRNIRYQGGCYIVRNCHGKEGAFDTNGRMIIPCDEYWRMYPIRTPELRFIARRCKNCYGEDAFRILLADGHPQSAESYDYIDCLLMRGNKLLFVKNENGGCGVMLPDETVVIPPIYDRLRCVGEKYLMFETGKMPDMVGLLDYTNSLVLPPVYSYIQQGIGDRLVVSKSDADDWRMSWNGVVELVPNEAYKQTLAQENCKRLIDALDLTFAGVEPKCVTREIIPPHYRRIEVQGKYYRVISAELRDGMLSPSGEVIIPCEYDFMEYCSDDYIAVKLGDDYFYINIRNERVAF